MYHQIASQRATMSIDLQMKDKNLQRKSHKVEELEKQIANLKEDTKNIRVQCDELKDVVRKRLSDAEQILAQPIFTQVTPTYAFQSNVLKALRGGGGTRLRVETCLGRKKSNAGMPAPAPEKIVEVPEAEGSPDNSK